MYKVLILRAMCCFYVLRVSHGTVATKRMCGMKFFHQVQNCARKIMKIRLYL